MKKWLLTLGSVGVIVAPIASVVACGDDDEEESVLMQQIGHVKFGGKVKEAQPAGRKSDYTQDLGYKAKYDSVAGSVVKGRISGPAVFNERVMNSVLQKEEDAFYSELSANNQKLVSEAGATDIDDDAVADLLDERLQIINDYIFAHARIITTWTITFDNVTMISPDVVTDKLAIAGIDHDYMNSITTYAEMMELYDKINEGYAEENAGSIEAIRGNGSYQTWLQYAETADWSQLNSSNGVTGYNFGEEVVIYDTFPRTGRPTEDTMLLHIGDSRSEINDFYGLKDY